MSSFPCLARFVSGSGQVRYRLGDRLVDRYLEFVAGRCRPNTLRAVTFDLKAFFTVIPKDPVAVTAVGAATAGTREQECTSSRCTITGLTNDAAYTMTVQAYNALGHGAASRPSAPIRPDVRPDAPNRPVGTSADGGVELSWQPPTNRIPMSR